MGNETKKKLVCGATHPAGGPPAFYTVARPDLNKAFTRVLGNVRVLEKGYWLFPAYAPFAGTVVSDLSIVAEDNGYALELTEKAEGFLRDAEERRVAAQELTQPFRDSFDFVTVPYRHQEDALRFAIALHRCAIFYDCGLGKTKIVFDFVRHEKCTAIVLVPTVGVDTWVREKDVHAPELRLVALRGTKKAREKIWEEMQRTGNGKSPYDVVVISYDTAVRDQLFFSRVRFDAIIADESHYLRTHNSQRTKCAVAIASRCERRIIMSGTPSLGNPLHLYGQLAFLARHFPAQDWWTFRKRYTTHAKGQPKYITGFKNLDMLNDKIKQIAVRRTKEDCLDLPERVFTDVYFSISGEQRRTYNELIQDTSTWIDTEMIRSPQVTTTILKLLQVLSGFVLTTPPPVCDGCEHVHDCVDSGVKPFTRGCPFYSKPYVSKVKRFKSNPKLKTLEDLIDSILVEKRHKIIVWAHFTEELNLVEELLQSKGVGYIRVDGSNSSSAQKFSRDFNQNPDIRVWLGQISTGVALTLTGASYVVYFGLNYNLDDYLQSMDRNYRIGQSESTFVYRILAKNTVLETLAKVLEQKIDISSSLVDLAHCVFCDRGDQCIPAGVEPFSSGCKKKSKVSRLRTRPKVVV